MIRVQWMLCAACGRRGGRVVAGGHGQRIGFGGHPALVALPGADQERAEELARHVGVPLLSAGSPAEAFARDERVDLALCLDAEELWLADGSMSMRADLTEMLPRLKPGRLQRELLVRAAKVRGAEEPPVAVDATAGMGEDAVLLAASGFSVILCERNRVIAALLRDALLRAGAVSGLADVVKRMHLVEGDSVDMLRAMAAEERRPPDVVYLDPMFPARKKSAAVKKKFQLLHRLEEPCVDQDALLTSALAARPRKVVVKRPAQGPFLAGRTPSYSLEGKAVRYDVVVP